MSHEVTVLKLLKHIDMLEQFEAFESEFEFCNFRYHDYIKYYKIYERITGNKKCNLTAKHLKSLYGLNASDSVFLNSAQFEVYRELESNMCKYCKSVEERIATRFCIKCKERENTDNTPGNALSTGNDDEQ